MPEPKRRAIPLSKKLHAVLLMLGFTEEEIEGGIDWDHNPPLAIRRVDPETGDWVPHQHDPRFLTPLRSADHARKTNGTAATTAGSDKHMIAKAKRQEAKRLEAQRQLLTTSAPPDKPNRRWPSRPFPKRVKS